MGTELMKRKRVAVRCVFKINEAEIIYRRNKMRKRENEYILLMET